MVVSNTRQYDNENTPSQAAFPMDDEALVAYLDGELTGPQAAAVESGLQASGELRDRLGHLKRAWEMLEELPDEQPNPKFAHTTMELIALNEERDLASRWALVRKLGILSAAGLSLMLIAYMATRQYQRGENRQALNDLHIFADWNAFKHIDSFEWLEKLESVEDLQTVAWSQANAREPSQGRKLGVETVPTAAELRLREKWVAELTEIEKGQLISNRIDFNSQSSQRQDAIRSIVNRIYESPESVDRYLRVARAYRMVLAMVSQNEIDRLADQNIEDRHMTLTRIVNGQIVDIFARYMPDKDREAITNWIAEMEEYYDSELPPRVNVRGRTQDPGDRVIGDFFRRRFPNWSPVITEDDLEQLRVKLTPEAQRILSQQGGKESEEAALIVWFGALAAPLQLKAEYEELSDDARERLEYMTPRRARETLRPRSGPWGKGGSRRGGPGFGGPPPASFMRPTNRPDSSPPTTQPDGSPAGTPPAL